MQMTSEELVAFLQRMSVVLVQRTTRALKKVSGAAFVGEENVLNRLDISAVQRRSLQEVRDAVLNQPQGTKKISNLSSKF